MKETKEIQEEHVKELIRKKSPNVMESRRRSNKNSRE